MVTAGDTPSNRGLARGCLTRPTLQHHTHDDFVHGLNVDPGPRHRLADGQSPEVRTLHRAETPEVTSHWCAGGSDNDRCCVFICHGVLPSQIGLIR